MELHLRGEYRAAISQFLKAADPDAGFTVPLLWAITASCNLEEYEQATAINEALLACRPRLSPAERLGADYFAEWLAGDRGAALRTLVASRSSSLIRRCWRSSGATRCCATVRAMQSRYWNGSIRNGAGSPSWTPYWQRLTEAYHMVGDHGRELDAARRGRRQHPEAMGPLLYEARAHAALGDADAVSRIGDDVVALGSDRFMSAGEALFTAARELKAHGHHRWLRYARSCHSTGSVTGPQSAR